MPKRSRRPSGAERPAPQPEPELEPPESSWTCHDCEQENDCTDATCIACGLQRPTGWIPQQVDSEAYLFQRVLTSALCSQLIRMSHERTFSLDLEHVDDKPVRTPY